MDTSNLVNISNTTISEYLGEHKDELSKKKLVLIGEASHGTSEYYLTRSLITKYLLENYDFDFVAVEADWPECYRINQYVKGYAYQDAMPEDILREFNRWPTWMWSNWEVAAFIWWLQKFNKSEAKQIGFYGLDVYSLHESLELVTNYLKDKDPEAYQTALKAYRCFEPYGNAAEDYAYATRLVKTNCESEVLDLLVSTLNQETSTAIEDAESEFNATQNALVVKNSENYYREMVKGGASSWNSRDMHMAQTVHRLLKFYGKDAKGIIWAHNTHIGDARATDMKFHKMLNIGQLLRESFGEEKLMLIGMGAYKGSVIAAGEWGTPQETMQVPEARQGSWEYFFQQMVGDVTDNYVLSTDRDAYTEMRGHRAIGVVYDPSVEQYGNYVPTNLKERYDYFIYFGETHALHPIKITETDFGKTPDLYPWGF
jgi:erythromycin esterase